jgi:hypothetical protein
MRQPLLKAAERGILLAAIIGISIVVATAAPITFDVNCNNMKVGTVSVDVKNAGISGSFMSTVGGPPVSLAGAAAACGEDHFNWYQVVTSDTNPPKDSKGNQLAAPYVDPPPGGYMGGTWEDNLPWYWNEYAGPGEMSSEISRQSTIDTLKFADFPSDVPGAKITFSTWLVSLKKDDSFDSWHGGFSWTYMQGQGMTPSGVSNIMAFDANPTDAQYKNITGGFATGLPEPSTLTLCAAGLLLLIRFRKRA